MDELKEKYTDEDMIIPLIYKGEKIGLCPNNDKARVFKFLDTDRFPSGIKGDNMTIVFLGDKNEDDIVENLSHCYILDDEDNKEIENGTFKWLN